MKLKTRIFSAMLSASIVCSAGFTVNAYDNSNGTFSDTFQTKGDFEGWQANNSTCATTMEITDDGTLHYTCENTGGKSSTAGGVVRAVNGKKGVTFAEGAQAVLKFRVKKDAGATLRINMDEKADGQNTINISGWYSNGGATDWRCALNVIAITDSAIKMKKMVNSFPYTEYDDIKVQTANKWIDFAIYYNPTTKTADWEVTVDGKTYSGKSKDWSNFGNINALTDGKWGSIAFLSYDVEGSSKTGSVYIDDISLSATKRLDMSLVDAEKIDGVSHFYLDTGAVLYNTDVIAVRDSNDNEILSDKKYIDETVLDIAVEEELTDSEYYITGLTGLICDGLEVEPVADIPVYPPEEFPIIEDFSKDLGGWKKEENSYAPDSVGAASGVMSFSAKPSGTGEADASAVVRKLNGGNGVLYKEGKNLLVKTRIMKDGAGTAVSLQLNRADTKTAAGNNAFTLLKLTDNGIYYRNGVGGGKNNLQELCSESVDGKFVDVTIYLDGYDGKALYYVWIDGTPYLYSAEGALGANNPFDSEKSAKNIAIKAEGASCDVSVDYAEVYKDAQLPKDGAVVSGYAETGESLNISVSHNKPAGQVQKLGIKWFVADASGEDFTEISGAVGPSLSIGTDNDGKIIKAELTPYEDNTAGEASFSNIATKRTAPEAKAVGFTGEMYVGETLVGEYTYYDINNDPENKAESVYTWYRTDANGVRTAIAGANKSTYTLTDADVGHKISFSVLPAATEQPEKGDKTYFSEEKQGPAKPTLANVVVKNQGAIYYIESYKYDHLHGCEQGDFKYSWVADGKQISGTASCTIDEDCSSLTLTVTPVAKKAPYEGDAVTVSISLPESDTKLVISGGSSGRGSGGSGGIVSVSGAADKLITSAEKEYKDSQKPQITVSDIDGHWAQESIIFAVENEIMSCDEENNFKPQNFATRAGVISAVAKAAGVAETAYTEEFGDVSEKDEFSGYLQSLVEMGVISRDAFFRPNDNITREEMCKVLTTLLGREKDGVTGEEAAHFSDRDQMGEWAVPYICCAISEKLMLGVSETEFSPKGKVTNAQLATLCKRISDSKGGQEN